MGILLIFLLLYSKVGATATLQSTCQGDIVLDLILYIIISSPAMAVAYFFGLRHGSQSKTILIALPAPPQFSAEECRVIGVLQSAPKTVSQLLHETTFPANLLEAVLIDLQAIDAIRLYEDGYYHLHPGLRQV